MRAMNETIRAVAFQEGGVWIVQGVEYDIVAQTDDPLEAPTAFLRAVVDTAMINARHGRRGLDQIKAAPPRFRTMFEQANKTLADINEPADLDDMSPPRVDLRVYRKVA